MGLNPAFPIVSGEYQLTVEWRTQLPEAFNRRVEDGDLVLWRPGLTLFLVVWNNDESETQSERLEWLRGDLAQEATDVRVESAQGITRLTYRLAEPSDDDRRPALYAFVIGEGGHVQLAAYFDDEADLAVSLAVVEGLREKLT